MPERRTVPSGSTSTCMGFPLIDSAALARPSHPPVFTFVLGGITIQAESEAFRILIRERQTGTPPSDVVSNVNLSGTPGRSVTSICPHGTITSKRRSLSGPSFMIARSEEHTSELQSLRHLVCRLLLE